MRRFETPYVADWLAASLRWIVLVGLIIAVSLRGQLGGLALWPLVLLFAWNVLMSLLAAFSIRAGRYHRQIVFVVDFLLAALCFWMQGGLLGAVAWVGVMPILTGAVYFETWGAFAAAGLFAASQYLISRDLFSDGVTLDSFTKLAWTLAVGLVSGLAGRFVMSRLRTSRRTRLDVEERRRHMESERLRAIYELSSTLTATLSYKHVLDSALDLSYTALDPNPDPEQPNGDQRLVSAVFLFKDNKLLIGSARRFTNADMHVNLHGN
jgi:hypothetical protein